MLSIYMRSCSAMAIGIGAEGARMMLKWGNRGKLARVAKRAIEWDRILQHMHNASREGKVCEARNLTNQSQGLNLRYVTPTRGKGNGITCCRSSAPAYCIIRIRVFHSLRTRDGE